MLEAHAFEPLDHTTPEEDKEVLRRLARCAGDRFWDGQSIEAIEVGSWAGSTALVLEEVLDRVYCVDHWQGNANDRLGDVANLIGFERVWQAFCRNMGDKLYRSVIPCRGTSQSYARVWPRKVALVFIDASHEYEHVREDILAWSNHVLPSGILCGHDWGVFPGVNQAVTELIAPDQLRTSGNIWWTQIPRDQG